MLYWTVLKGITGEMHCRDPFHLILVILKSVRAENITKERHDQPSDLNINKADSHTNNAYDSGF